MYIVYGLDTKSIEDPDQTSLLRLGSGAEDCEDADALIRFIDENWGSEECVDQPVVGLDDVLESFRLAMEAEGIAPEAVTRITDTVTDAVSNNIYA